MSLLRFSVQQWCHWSVDSSSGDGLTEPPLPQVPAIQRRRMTSLGKAAMHVAFGIEHAHPDIPLIFASRHGDLSRSISLLEELTSGSPVSPTQFGLSVHNSIGALHGILTRHTGPYTAIAAGEETPEQAFHEACGLLDDGARAVRVVYYDAPPPAPYDCFGLSPVTLHAWACLVQLANSGPAIHLMQGPLEEPPSPDSLAGFFAGNTSRLIRHAGHRAWIWHRHA